MGVPEADLKKVQACCRDWLELFFAQPSPERQIECAHNAIAYQNYFKALIEQRRAAPQADLISDLIEANDSGEVHLSQEELLLQSLGIVIAGYDTTPGLLGNCVHQVLRDRSLWQTIRENPELIHSVIEETVRFAGAASVFFRTTTEAVELGGITLPKGVLVIMLLNSANHDETQFPDPQVFNLQRTNLTRHVGFGSGIHFCLGAPLARLEARVALEVLSTRLPSLRLVPDQELSYKRSMAVRGLNQLLVEWDVDSNKEC